MRAVVVYESMFGNTHLVAERIAEGLRSRHEVIVSPVGEVTDAMLDDAELLVVGGPTHVHGLSSSATRMSAREMAEKDDDLELDPDAAGPGLRNWLDGLERRRGGAAAAFDTRVTGPAVVTGRASKGIARRLARHGYHTVIDPQSFLVDKQNHLLAGEGERAVGWGQQLAAILETAPA